VGYIYVMTTNKKLDENTMVEILEKFPSIKTFGKISSAFHEMM